MKDIEEHIIELIISYAKNDIDEKGFNKLSQWLGHDDDNKQLFSDYLLLYKRTRRIGLLHALDQDKAWDIITSKLENPIENHSKKEKRVISIRPWFKYAAAVVVGLFIAGYVLKDDLLNVSDDNVIPIIVETNEIIPGTDKATLTLEDGSQIALEKGASFQTSNANSNGEQITYDKDSRKTKELVYNYLTIPRGGQFHIVLSDGTQVWLNSESQLKYPVSFIDGQTRQVELVYGEAYFDVSPSSQHKGAKFKVLNKSQEVEVLGTEFNVKAYNDETKVYTTLVEGKVLVNVENKTQNLIPNQQLSLDIKTFTSTIKTVDVYNEVSWKDGVFSFENKSLKEMMKVLSRWYDVDIEIKNKEIENEEFVGILRKNKKLDVILTNIKNFGIIKNFEIEDKKVVLE